MGDFPGANAPSPKSLKQFLTSNPSPLNYRMHMKPHAIINTEAWATAGRKPARRAARGGARRHPRRRTNADGNPGADRKNLPTRLSAPAVKYRSDKGALQSSSEGAELRSRHTAGSA